MKLFILLLLISFPFSFLYSQEKHVNFDSAKGKNFDSILNKIQKIDTTLYRQIANLKSKDNVNELYNFSITLIPLLIRKEDGKVDSLSFMKILDNQMFNRFIQVKYIPDSLRFKFSLLQNVNLLENFFKIENSEEILKKLENMKITFDSINEGTGLLERRKLNETQRSYIKQILLKFTDIYDPWLEINMIVQKQIDIWKGRYQKSIQQAFLNSLLNK